MTPRALAEIGLWRVPILSVCDYRSSTEFGLVVVVELSHGRTRELPAAHAIVCT